MIESVTIPGSNDDEEEAKVEISAPAEGCVRICFAGKSEGIVVEFEDLVRAYRAVELEP